MIKDKIIGYCNSLGLDTLGFIPCRRFEELVEFYKYRKENNLENEFEEKEIEKRINPNNDRLVYYIGKPFYNKFKKVIEIYINVNSCSGHTFRGKNGQGNIRSFNEDDKIIDDFWSNHQLSDLNW